MSKSVGKRHSDAVLAGLRGSPGVQARKRIAAAAPDMLAKLKDACLRCGYCDGKGNAYTMADETQVGQAPGSSRIDCPNCKSWRAAIAKATEPTAQTSA